MKEKVSILICAIALGCSFLACNPRYEEVPWQETSITPEPSTVEPAATPAGEAVVEPKSV